MVTQRPGLTLVEVVVAITLLGVAGLGAAAIALGAARSFQQTELRQRLLWAAEATLDSLLSLPANSAGSRSMSPGTLHWNAADSVSPVTVRVSAPFQMQLDITGER